MYYLLKHTKTKGYTLVDKFTSIKKARAYVETEIAPNLEGWYVWWYDCLCVIKPEYVDKAGRKHSQSIDNSHPYFVIWNQIEWEMGNGRVKK